MRKGREEDPEGRYKYGMNCRVTSKEVQHLHFCERKSPEEWSHCLSARLAASSCYWLPSLVWGSSAHWFADLGCFKAALAIWSIGSILESGTESEHWYASEEHPEQAYSGEVRWFDQVQCCAVYVYRFDPISAQLWTILNRHVSLITKRLLWMIAIECYSCAQARANLRTLQADLWVWHLKRGAPQVSWQNGKPNGKPRHVQKPKAPSRMEMWNIGVWRKRQGQFSTEPEHQQQQCQ